MSRPTTVGNGRYRLHEALGRGGMGTVWRATDELLDRDVAIKQVRLDDLPPAEVALARERTMREARIAARLHHSTIVTIFDVVTESDEQWLVLEYLPSRSLAAVLAEQGPLPVQEVARIGREVATALAVAHAAGVVHRDVKPENILIATAAPHAVKLTDFGISHTAGGQTLTAHDVINGTPRYFAPETARGEGTSRATDMYSLGATLYTAVDGAPPFGAGDGNVLALVARIATGGAPPPRRAGPLTATLTALVADDPDMRPTAERTRSALAALAHEPTVVHPAGHAEKRTLTVEAPSLPPVPPPPPIGTRQLAAAARPRRRWAPWLVGIGGLLVAALVATLIIATDRSSSPSAPSTPVAAAPTTSATPSGLVPSTQNATITNSDAADPCAFADPVALSDHGDTTLDRDQGKYTQCRVDIKTTMGTVVYTVDLQDEFVTPPPDIARQEVVGPIRVIRFTAGAGDCQNRIKLVDGTTVIIDVHGSTSAAGILCGIAETGTDAAVRRLAARGVTTRVLESPLAKVDACTLVSGSEVTAVPGTTETPRRGYGTRECFWTTTAPRTRVAIYPIRQTDPHYQPSVSFAGHRGRVNYATDNCTADVAYREYWAPPSGERFEALEVVVYGSEKEPELCGYASALARAAAARLPAAT